MSQPIPTRGPRAWCHASLNTDDINLPSDKPPDRRLEFSDSVNPVNIEMFARWSPTRRFVSTAIGEHSLSNGDLVGPVYAVL